MCLLWVLGHKKAVFNVSEEGRQRTIVCLLLTSARDKGSHIFDMHQLTYLRRCGGSGGSSERAWKELLPPWREHGGKVKQIAPSVEGVQLCLSQGVYCPLLHHSVKDNTNIASQREGFIKTA